MDEVEIVEKVGAVLGFVRDTLGNIPDVEKLTILRSAASVIEAIIGAKSLTMMTAKYLNK